MSLLYSPFDALGLDPAPHIKKKILQAYRRAMLHCHPDTRKKHDIDMGRWPTKDQLDAAKEFLEAAFDEQGCVHRGTVGLYLQYPRTFFPTEALGSPRVYQALQSSIQNFSQCGKCHMVVPSSFLSSHIQGEHPILACELCGDVLSTPPQHGHYQEAHPEKFCRICSDLVNGDIEEHTQWEHHCQFCGKELSFQGLIQHTIDCHSLDPCEECEGIHSGKELTEHFGYYHDAITCPICKSHHFDVQLDAHLSLSHSWEPCPTCSLDDPRWPEHLTKQHSWLKCPFCREIIMEDKLWAHLASKTSHLFRKCASCPPSAKAFVADVTHIKTMHAIQQCIECPERFAGADFKRHLSNEHRWKQCPYCDRLEPPTSYEEHVTMDHRFENCPECEELIETSMLKLHLTGLHSWRQCHHCDKVAEVEVLRRHTLESHNQTESCPVCPELQTVQGLSFHLREAHSWAKCSFCEKVMVPQSIQLHIEEHQLETCKVCHDLHPEAELPSHLREAHLYKQCPFCETLESEDVLRQHIWGFHFNAGQGLPNIAASGGPPVAMASEVSVPDHPDSAVRDVRSCLFPRCDFKGSKSEVAKHRRLVHRRPGESPSVKQQQKICPYPGCGRSISESNVGRHIKKDHRHRE